MTLSEYRNTLSWKGAIDLGPGLIRLAEEMPASEELGLSLQMRQAMVELPAAVAADLTNSTNTRHAVIFKLVAALDLVDRVFPALDTAGTKQAVEQLVGRLTGPDFAEGAQPSTPAPAPAPEPTPTAAPEPAPEPAVPAEPEPAPAPAPEPTRVAVQPAPQEESVVHPDSSQQAQ